MIGNHIKNNKSDFLLKNKALTLQKHREHANNISKYNNRYQSRDFEYLLKESKNNTSNFESKEEEIQIQEMGDHHKCEHKCEGHGVGRHDERNLLADGKYITPCGCAPETPIGINESKLICMDTKVI